MSFPSIVATLNLLYILIKSEIITCGSQGCQHQNITCSDSDCTINCIESYSCVNSTVLCGSGQCHINCGYQACKYSTINCSNSASCKIECADLDACRYSNIIGATNVSCSDNYACASSSINCSSDEYCNVQCTHHRSCDSMVINHVHNITCNGNYGCIYSTINCIDPDFCSINCGWEGCRHSNIDCSKSNNCNVICDNFHACANSTINGPKYISCVSTQQEACINSTINCYTDQCDILCNGHTACTHSSINCSESKKCNLECNHWNACSYSNITGATDISCGLGNQFACINSTMNCYTDECNIICNGHTACQHTAIDCRESETCNVECNNWHSCSYSTITGATDISCSNNDWVGWQPWGCYGSIMRCKENHDCNVHCGREGCFGGMIYSPIGYNSSIICDGYKGCYDTVMIGIWSLELHINGCTADQSCLEMHVWCPPNDFGDKKCIIQGDDSFGSTGLEIYAIYGWDDVQIDELATNYGGLMYCTTHYNVTCAISNVEWLCDNSSSICNDPPTSNPTRTPTIDPTTTPTFIPTTVPTFIPTTVPAFIPTTVPTFIPTTVPTFIPTISPISHLTPIPTFDPTVIPTFYPSNIPTKLTCVQTSDEFTASFVITFDYIENKENLSNAETDDIIHNVTETFIEETISKQTNCKLDTYDNTINANNNNAVIDIIACFECGISLSIDDYDEIGLQKDFIETFERETNILTVKINSTIVAITINKPEGQVSDTTKFVTTSQTILDSKKQNKNNLFIIMMIIFGITIGFCIACFVSICIHIKRKDVSSDQKEEQGISMINMPQNTAVNIKKPERICSNSNIQIGEDIEIQNDDMIDVNHDIVTAGSLSDMIISLETKEGRDDEIIGDDEETPNDTNDDSDSIIIVDDEETQRATNSGI